jgi:hypothetical protein
MAAFRFDTAKGQICPRRCEGNITGPRQHYPLVKKRRRNIYLSLAGSVVRDRVKG